MRKFNKFLTPAIAALGIAALMPASAMAATHPGKQDSRQMSQRYDDKRPVDMRRTDSRAALRSDIAQLGNRIDRAERNKAISRREASGLRRDVAKLQKQYRDYARNGLSRSESAVLSHKIDRIQLALRAERHDRDRRRG